MKTGMSFRTAIIGSRSLDLGRICSITTSKVAKYPYKKKNAE